jgi:hypothetical protein
VGAGPTVVEDIADELAEVELVEVDVGLTRGDIELSVYDGKLNDMNEDELDDAGGEELDREVIDG